MNKKIMIGIMGLFILATATLVIAGSGGVPRQFYQVTNVDDNSTYWFAILVSANTNGNCTDTDGGAKPFSTGTIDVDTINPVGHRHLTDYNGTAGKIREFVCGSQIYDSGIPGYAPTKAYLMVWDPNYVPQ